MPAIAAGEASLERETRSGLEVRCCDCEGEAGREREGMDLLGLENASCSMRLQRALNARRSAPFGLHPFRNRWAAAGRGSARFAFSRGVEIFAAGSEGPFARAANCHYYSSATVTYTGIWVHLSVKV